MSLNSAGIAHVAATHTDIRPRNCAATKTNANTRFETKVLDVGSDGFGVIVFTTEGWFLFFFMP